MDNSLLNDSVAAQMEVYVDGLLISSFAVANTTDFADYTIDPALLGVDAHQVDVVFVNDAYLPGNPTQDRNLYVDNIRVNGRSLASNSIGVQYDLGKGNAALDGKNLIAGRGGMAWNGALRFGLDGNDLLDGGSGTDTLIGGQGSDTYRFGRGYGIDSVIENDTTLGHTDIAQFMAGVSSNQLWFQRTGNNLEVDIIGTADKLLIKDWYSGSANHIEQFKTSNGLTLLDNQVENLVNAMAAFAPPSAGQTRLPQDYQTALAPVLAANWQ
jgi:Ca2+-binding RTX toxin-like protein